LDTRDKGPIWILVFEIEASQLVSGIKGRERIRNTWKISTEFGTHKPDSQGSRTAGGRLARLGIDPETQNADIRKFLIGKRQKEKEILISINRMIHKNMVLPSLRRRVCPVSLKHRRLYRCSKETVDVSITGLDSSHRIL
jgi:hypothetical protein